MFSCYFDIQSICDPNHIRGIVGSCLNSFLKVQTCGFLMLEDVILTHLFDHHL